MGKGLQDKTRQGLLRRMLLLALALLAVCAPAAAQDWNYRVRPGDTLWDLTAEYLKPDVPWQRLQEHNRIGDPYRLPPGTLLRIPMAWLHVRPARATVVAIQGDATARGKERAMPVTAGMTLPTGTWLETAPQASLSLRFTDGSRLMLLGDSQLLLERLNHFGRSDLADIRLRLQRGRIGNEVRPQRGPSSFIVDTPSASSAVRGTRFRVETTDGRTYTEVLEGRVAVNSARRSALVQRGYGTVVAEGGDGVRPVALLPAPDLSRVAAQQQRAQPALAWPAVPGADRYRVQLSRQVRFDTVQVDLETREPNVQLPALEEGEYHLRVRASNADGLEGLDAQVAFRVGGQPEPPYTISPPAQGVVRTPAVALAWTQAPGARAYQYEVAADAAGFAAPLAAATVHGATGAELAQPLAPGEYVWRIRSVDAAGKTGPWGDALPFTVRPLIDITGIDSPAAGKHRDVTFRWPAGQPGQRYRFQMSRTPDFAQPQVDEVVEQAEITLPRLRSGTWYLRARAVDVDGFEGAFPPAQRVDVPCRWCRIGAGAGALLILLAL